MSTLTPFGRRTAIKIGLAGAATALAPRRARAQNPKEVKIALVVPLSGPWARQGILEQMGAELAIEDVNKSGGVKALGGAKLKITNSPAPGTYRIIDNRFFTGVHGIFGGLPAGATLPGLSATISYVGGTGNDVVVNVT